MSVETRRIALSTGISLNVATAGDPSAEPILFLHGFPESHRTWRHQLRDLAGTTTSSRPTSAVSRRRTSRPRSRPMPPTGSSRM